jgi:hypothetical protein
LGEKLVDLTRVKENDPDAEHRRFLFLLALALFSLPSSQGKTQPVSETSLSKMLVDGGIPKDGLKRRFASQLTSQLRNKIQAILPKGEFRTAKHYLVGEGKKGYYLNTGYHIKWMEPKTRF